MSLSRTAAGVFGAVYVVVGILGFVPVFGGSTGIGDNNLLGLFPINVVHNIVHLGVGVLGLAAYASGVPASRLFARGIGLVYASLAVIGAFVNSGNLLGIVPIGGLDILLHAVTAAALLYVGFAPPERARAVAHS